MEDKGIILQITLTKKKEIQIKKPGKMTQENVVEGMCLMFLDMFRNTYGEDKDVLEYVKENLGKVGPTRGDA